MFLILDTSRYILWKKSIDSRNWFKNIKYKKTTTFIHFSIIDFHPSTTKKLSMNSINFTSNYTDITKRKLDNILASRKSVPINNDTTSVKTFTDNFDVTMGSFDSAQIADLVGIYIYIYIVSKVKWATRKLLFQ